MDPYCLLDFIKPFFKAILQVVTFIEHPQHAAWVQRQRIALQNRQFFKWAAEEGEIADSPMAKMGPPSVPEVPVPVVGDDDLKKLLKTCEGATFDNGLLHIDLVRRVPEAMKPRRIEIGAGPAAVKDSKARAIKAA